MNGVCADAGGAGETVSSVFVVAAGRGAQASVTTGLEIPLAWTTAFNGVALPARKPGT